MTITVYLELTRWLIRMSRDIKVEQFTLAYKGQTLLKDADLTIIHGRKYGLIGPNGSGTSSLSPSLLSPFVFLDTV